MLFASIIIRAPRIRPKPTWVLVDTGSPWTAITSHDALMLNIPLSKLRVASRYPIITFASHRFERLILANVSLLIRDENRRTQRFVMPSISVLKPTKKMKPDFFKAIPSVMGIDFLSEHDFGLHFNPSKEIAFLSS